MRWQVGNYSMQIMGACRNQIKAWSLPPYTKTRQAALWKVTGAQPQAWRRHWESIGWSFARASVTSTVSERHEILYFAYACEASHSVQGDFSLQSASSPCVMRCNAPCQYDHDEGHNNEDETCFHVTGTHLSAKRSTLDEPTLGSMARKGVGFVFDHLYYQSQGD